MDTDGIYRRQTGMIDEMIQNSVIHGNRGNKEKRIYLLWHKCQFVKEVYIVDEGEKEFDINNIIEKPGIIDEVTGLDTLRGRSKGFEYFNIVDESSKKKGTLLRVILECGKGDLQVKPVECDYYGHQLLA